MIDRKYIDAKVIEAHIVPGKLLVTRWLKYHLNTYIYILHVCLSEKYLKRAKVLKRLAQLAGQQRQSLKSNRSWGPEAEGPLNFLSTIIQNV